MADKVGLDDFIAAGGDVEGLILNSTPAGELATNATSAETRIAELSTLSALDYDRVRKGVADDLGVRASTLDRAVAAKRQKAAEDAKEAAELAAAPSPWADPVDGAALLNEIAGTLRKFVVMSERDAWLAALWVLHSYMIDIAEISPILRIVSPTPSCGKSTLVAILARIVRRGYIVAQISNAAFARLVHIQRPTLEVLQL